MRVRAKALPWWCRIKSGTPKGFEARQKPYTVLRHTGPTVLLEEIGTSAQWANIQVCGAMHT